MTPTLTRRSCLACGTALAMLSMIPARARAAADAKILTATTRTLDVRGRAVSVMGLLGSDGRPGLVLDPSERFRVELTNDLAEPTIIHWHGQIPPNRQDGVPDSPMPVLAPGEARSFDFMPRPGTHWMHSHLPLQEMALLAAPLVVRRAADAAEDRQEVVMFLHDLSFDPPEAVLARLGIGGEMADMDHGGMAGHDMDAMAALEPGDMAMDVNDIAFDAYLANDRTLDDPEVVSVEPGGRVRLRVINAASATAFWIDTGEVPAQLVAVDGEDVEPIAGTRFGLSMGQRLDLLLDLPGSGAFPILALREAAPERAGIVLATPGATVPRILVRGEAASPVFDTDLAQEGALRARVALLERPPEQSIMLMLEGSMAPYRWTINGGTWPDVRPIEARSGERAEIIFHNMSMMAHPMHLHGHVFQVVDVGQGRFTGAVRDTVLVPPMASVTVALDVGEAADWMLHCHHMPHLATGMMTALRVTA